MTFSGTVKLSGLDDHITPSQACVIALDGTKLKDSAEDAEVKIHQRSEQPLPALKKDSDGNTVKISLQDCLACSGCVTTAETVLLQQQSLEEFISRLTTEGTTTVVSLSPQTRSSLAVYYGLSPSEAASRLAGFLKSLGVLAVLDISSARDISLMEAAAEFCHRFRATSPPHMQTSLQAGEGMDVDGSSVEVEAPGRVPPAPLHLPMLASACPGWICYAEKTHGSYVLPYISTTKSPQAVMGTLLKRQLAPQLGLPSSNLFHCSLQPCYDKKLEASRDDFELGGGVKETDCVLSSLEIVELLDSKGLSLRDCPVGSMDSLVGLMTGGQRQTADPGAMWGWPGGSGGYVEFVYRVAAQELFGMCIPPGPLPFTTLRNNDYKEVKLEVNGQAVLRFAIAYGFRNIQTLMRKVKRNQCEFHYVEIMACPSGCLNGGGQIRPTNGQSVPELIKLMEETYHHQDVVPRWPGDGDLVKHVYSHLGACFTAQARMLFHTQYHKREKSSATAIADW
mmetsp:Transcript_4086/g.11532  ORF Transcript_4086/g.11532 Transcript_4086/m.11532 type:complete len:508 (+) Transcript_4086:279-1802(+)